MFPNTHLNPWDCDLDTIADANIARVGGVYYNDGELFMFVLNNSADTDGIKGQYALNDDAGTYGYITMKAAEAGDGGVLGTVAKAVGMFCNALDFGNYGYLKVWGTSLDSDHSTAILVTDGGVTQGEPLVCDGGATPTFIADTAVAGEEHAVVGHSWAADVGTVVVASLNCL